MQRRSGRAGALLATLVVLAAGWVVPAAADVIEIEVPSLWVVDDQLRVTANVTLTGERLSSFRTPSGAVSSIAVDPLDGTLWGVNEGGSAGTSKLVNYDRTGQVIEEISTAEFGAEGAEGISLALSTDGALWVVDDPDTAGLQPTVYRVGRDGSLLSSFTTGSSSPQDIAHDPYDDTLWIVDNAADAVLHVTVDGTLLGSFETDSGPFVTADLPDGLSNPQGITVDSPTTLWLSSRESGLIHRVDKAGTTVLATLPSSIVGDGGVDPVGLAHDTRATVDSTRTAMRAIAAALSNAAASLTGSDADRVGRAADELDDALTDQRVWTDDGEPTQAEGKRALERMRDALDELADVEAADPTLASVEAALLQLSRDTSVASIQLAVDLATARDHVATGREKLARGDEKAAEGDLRGAADEYKKAWEEGWKAIEGGTGLLPTGASLWVVDDGLRVTGNVTLTGLLTTSFPTPNTAISSIAVDPLDGTLWGVNEGGASGAGKLVNYDPTGHVIREIQATTFTGFGVEGMSVAPAPDGTLWVVDDPDTAGREPTVHRVSRAGTGLSSFTTASFWPETRSPQDIAYDPYDGTLWITDNSVDRVFNVTTDGRLLRSFATDGGPFVTPDTPAGIRNPQGITVESATHLWLSSRDTGTIHRVAKTGSVVLQTIPASAVAPGASAPVGIAFSDTTPTPTTGDTAGTRGELASLRDAVAATGALLGGDDVERVAQAVAELDEALADERVWTVDGGPTEDHGKDALDAIKKALGELAHVETDEPAVPSAEAGLLALSRATAEAQLTLAAVLAPDSDHLGHGDEKLAKGDVEAARGDLERAADEYKKAWEEATRAIEESR